MLDIAASEKDVHADFYNGSALNFSKNLKNTEILFQILTTCSMKTICKAADVVEVAHHVLKLI